MAFAVSAVKLVAAHLVTGGTDVYTCPASTLARITHMQVANVATPEARLITIQPWEQNLIREIEKAIQMSDLGLTPSNDGKMIRIPLPPLTEERRKDLIKVCKKHGEEMKVQIRGFRRDGNEELKKLQKDAKLTEDELRKSETEIQKFTDQYVQKIDDMMKKKEGEILEV